MSSFRDLDAFLKEVVNKGPAGCGCMVAQDGEILYEGYHGYADVENGKLITDDSVYRQFSTTKLMVCTAAMKLFEQGKFLMTDPIYEYFPEWKDTQVADKDAEGNLLIRPAARPITVQDCFSMRMGIGYGGEDHTHKVLAQVQKELKEKEPNYTLRQDIEAMSNVPIRFDPGTHFLYGHGHELVAGLIEVVTGKTVGEYLKEALIDPLEMKSTGYQYFGDMREKMVSAYTRKEDGSLVKINTQSDALHEPDCKYQGGGSGLFSTVRDYLNFSQMMANGGVFKGEQIIGRKTIDVMRSNLLPPEQMKDFTWEYVAGYGYGYGVRTLIDPSAGVNTSVGEFGWTGMMGTYVVMDPAEKTSVVYMHNLVPNMEAYIHPRVRNIAFGALK